MAKVPQAHGGALNAGGTPGNKGGTGRPPSELRDMLRGSFAERIAILQDIADGKVVQRVKVAGQEADMEVSADVADRIRAIDMLAKYGLGPAPQEVKASGGLRLQIVYGDE